MRFALLVFFALLAVLRAEEIRVLTFNIRYDRPDPGVRAWTERRDAVAAIIREHADLAGLQEVLPNQRRELAERAQSSPSWAWGASRRTRRVVAGAGSA